MKKEKTIKVCDRCEGETPLKWTFLIPYCEYYCINCGHGGGIFGTGKDVPVTRELLFKKRIVDAVWKVLDSNKGAGPRGRFRRDGCKKCDEDGGDCNHRKHMGDAEKEWDEIGWKYIEEIKGIFN